MMDSCTMFPPTPIQITTAAAIKKPYTPPTLMSLTDLSINNGNIFNNSESEHGGAALAS